MEQILGMNPPQLPQSGYRRLVALMCQDKNAAILRRFDDINLLCLLKLQAEIVELRQKFYRTCYVDELEGDEDERAFSANFEKSRDGNSEQFQILEKLETRLAKYSKYGL